MQTVIVIPPTARTRKLMQSVRRRDTAPEVALRSALHGLGLRFRVDMTLIAGSRKKADIVFASLRTVVFVDGCFWHGCPLHHTRAKRNANFWKEKVVRNRARDASTDAQLAALGWLVIHVWEHEAPAPAAEAIRAVLAARGSKRSGRWTRR